MADDNIALDHGWRATLFQHGDWVCARLHPSDDQSLGDHGLIEKLWKEIDRRGTHNAVIEMQEVSFLPSSLMGELVRLHKRLATHSGHLRLAALRHNCAEALHTCRLDTVLPVYASSEDALA